MKLAADMFPGPVRVFEMDPRMADVAWLQPEEAGHVARAIDKRRREFAAGRKLARSGMQELGVAGEPPLVPGEDRVPIWPNGVVGTITHTENWAIAAVAWEHEVRELGVDVEQDSPMREPIWRRICRPDEQRWVESLDATDRGLWGKVIFSAKECAYKAQYIYSRTFLDFYAMEISVETHRDRFSARFCVDAGPYRVGDCLEGEFRIQSGLIVTAIARLAGTP